MPQVYISSSFSDLVEYREAASRAVRALSHEPIGMEDYTASNRPPLEKCLNDVANCAFYVGIVAWRYGSSPPDSEKSFTELEFEAALQKGVSCLVFFSAEAHNWPGHVDEDRSQVEAFRNAISQSKTVKFFDSPADLEAKVSQALHQELKLRPASEVRITPILPYLLDRSVQREELADAISNHRERSVKRPLFIAIDGDEREEHGPFIDRLEQVTLPKLLNLESQTDAIKGIELHWLESSGNVKDKVQHRLERMKARLAEELTGDRMASREQIAAAITGLRSPLLITSSILSDDWQNHEPELISEWLSWWADWPNLPHGQALIVFLSFVYADPIDRSFFARRTARKQISTMQSVLDRLSQNADPIELVRLTTLASVKESDVQRWLDEHVGEFIKRSSASRIRDPLELQEALMPWVRARFRADGGKIAMQDLADELRSKVNQCLNEGI